MSKKSKNSLLSGQAPASSATLAKQELLHKRYTMDHPENGVYPLSSQVEPLVYPDFEPFREGDAHNDKLANQSILNKGLFESPQVSNEYFSARNLIQETIFSSSQNCTKILGQLSTHLSKAYKARNEFINQISSASNQFKLAPRVTLTASKRDAWLRDLANPDVHLSTISNRLPHGIRNKVLVDCMCNHNVPNARAVWFTKCVLYSEQMSLRKRVQARNSSVPGSSPSIPSPRVNDGVSSVLEVLESRWLQEWTSQIADYVLKFSREMSAANTSEKSASYKAKLNYLIRFVQTLYVEFLLDRLTFLQAVIGFLREELPLQIEELPVLLEIANTDAGESSPALENLLRSKPWDFGQTLVALTLMKIFWKDIIKEEFLSKQVCESLLLNYFIIERVSVHDQQKPNSAQLGKPDDDSAVPSVISASLKAELLRLIGHSVIELFLLNNNLFILPDYWILIGNVLYRILLGSPHLIKLSEDSRSIESTLQLIHFRNESLMLNMKHSYKHPSQDSKAKRRSSFLKDSKPDKWALVISQLSDSESSSFNRTSEDNLRFVDSLDKLKLNNNLASLLTPTSSSAAWKVKVKILVYWCVTIYRDMGESSEVIHILCNFVKRKILQKISTRSSASLKMDFENEILESIFSLADEPRNTINMRNIFVLVNQCYQLKIISMSSYLRKIIACGIFYLSNSSDSSPKKADSQLDFHLELLSNLPALTNKQYFHIVKKWTSDVAKFSDSFEKGIRITKEHILDSLSSGKFSENYGIFLDEIKSMNTGVKFSIVNWLTPQIIATISNSPKLIHIWPSTVANIYLFYSCTDNLTVFFKIIIKIILKNEDKVLIYYLDTLHYISKLACHHYNLLRVIAGNTYDSVSMAYEIFKSMIICYIDISTRETDIYKFKEIWEFINKSIGKGLREESCNQHPSGIKSLIFDKETMESPLKVQTQSPKRSDAFSADSFVSELNKLVSSELPLLSDEELAELVGECQLTQSDPLSGKLTPENLSSSIESVLNSWFHSFSREHETRDAAFSKILEHLKRLSKRKSQQLLYDVFFSFINKTLEKPENSRQLVIFLMKLLSFGTISHFDLLALLEDVSNSNNSKDVGQISLQLVLNSSIARESLSNSQYLMFQIQQADYRENNKDSVFCLFIHHAKNMDLMTLDDLEGGLEVMRSVIIANKKLAFSLLTQECMQSICLFLCNRLLDSGAEPGALKIKELADIPKCGELLSEFSLPIFQLLLRSLTSEKALSIAAFKSISIDFLDNLRFPFDHYNSFFGELYNYLDWEPKEKVFFIFEDYYLSKDPGASDIGNEQSFEVIPMLKDFFEKISMSHTENFKVSSSTFRQLSQVLQVLLKCVESEDTTGVEERSVSNSLSIFLRLLIIHNSSLSDIMYTQDSTNFVFLRDLVKLYESEYFAKNDEKLRILLYDLLLLFKNSLTQLSTTSQNDVLLEEVSPNAIAEEDASMDQEVHTDATSLRVSGSSEALNGRNLAATVSSILDLPEPTSSTCNASSRVFECSISMDEEELYRSSDISWMNNGAMVVSEREKQTPVLNLIPAHGTKKTFAINNFRLIEDTSEGLNNGCVSLSLFEAYTTKENPF